MGLKPLEFSDCLLDSPYFRESIHDHEKELDETNESIKLLIKECRNLTKALDNLKKVQSSFSTLLKNFKLRYIGEVEVDDDLEYEDAFETFSTIIDSVEQERERMITHAKIQLIDPLENFRKEQIGHAKEEKKKFERETERVCGLVDAHLKQSPKKKDNALMEADAQLEHELRNFRQISLDYVSMLQEVNEKKKFEFVEILLAFMFGQSLFYHNGHEVYNDYTSYLKELALKLQTTRAHFEVTRQEAEDLKNKTTKKFHNGELHKGMHARQGYLYVNDKKRGVLGPAWVKHYCLYTKENKILTMVPYTQTDAKINSSTDTFVVQSCTRKPTLQSERRFLFDVTANDRSQPITLQSMSEEDRNQWLEVMEGKEPIYQESTEFISQHEGVTVINDTGLHFVKKCIEAVEKRGIDDQGIYRKAGVSSKFNKLLNTGTDPKQIDKLDLVTDNSTWEINTITSAMKQYFRNLGIPLLTYKHHNEFLQAVKLETEEKKISRLKELIDQLPENHYTLLQKLMSHLKLVAEHADKNLMEQKNLGVVLGPTLMRPKEETMAAIMGIKYQSLVVETMIQEYEQLFTIDKTICATPTMNIQPSFSNSKIASPKKTRAPDPPCRPANLPVKSSKTSITHDTDNKPIIENKPGTNNTIPAQQKPQSALRYAEAISPITSPPIADPNMEADDEDVKSRRQSYAKAMDFRVKSTQFEGNNKPPHPAMKPRLSDSNGPPVIPRRKEWKVRALYNCVAENESELSFNIGAIITNVRNSTEEGWLLGTLNGKTGYVPLNYCERID